MLTDIELNSMGEAIKEIGQDKTCFVPFALEDTRKALLEKDYEGAEDYAGHLTGTEYNELSRVLIICKKHNLGSEAAAKMIENLNRIESGRW